MMTYDEAVEQGLVFQDKHFLYDSPIRKGLFRKYVRTLLWFPFDLFCRLLLFIKPTKRSFNYKFEISICAIFKNEALFLKEWIEYHLLVGVDHFYLYNNNSDDNYREIIEEYVVNGIVTLIDWPENPGQISAYKNWYSNYRNETRWVSFLDLDEFITPLYNNSLKSWIKKFEKYPTVMVYWKMFGTSGKLEHDDSKMVIEQYTTSWPKLTNIGKLFYQTRFETNDFNLGMMHSFCVRHCHFNIPPINQFGYFVKYNIHKVGNSPQDIQINHYWSKAYNAYLKKHERGDAAFGISPRDFKYFLWHEQRNTSMDNTAYRFLVQVKIKHK